MEKLKNFWLNHKVKIIVTISFGILFTIILLKLNRNTFVPNDDTAFSELVSQFSTVWDYLANRLSTWSSRVLPEIFTYFFSPRSINYWRLVSVVVYFLTSFLGYKLYKILSPKLNDKKDAIFLAIIMGSFLLMGLNVVDNYGAVYWVTGAMSYFWLTPLFLAALFSPLYILVNKKTPRKLGLGLSIISTLLLTVSHEQFGIVLIILLALLTIYLIVKNRKLPIWPVILLLIAASGFLVHILAPGNHIRLQEEVVTWLPDLYEVPLLVRFESSIRWFFDAILNQTGYLLPVIWILLSILLFKQSKKTIHILIVICLMSFAILGLFADKIMLITSFLREFYPVWGFVGNAKDWIPILIYIAVFIITLYAMYVIAKGDKLKAAVPIILTITAACTIGMMCLSPTMYASNYRTLYVASVMFVMVIVVLLNRVLSNSKALRSAHQ